jgi:AraC family transcriptional regulator
MEPRIITIAQKQLIGQSLEMSLVDDKTQELFSSFMPQKKDITNTLSTDVFEILIYPSNYFKPFNPNNRFTKWAAVEVKTFDKCTEQLETFTLNSGLYAVFTYKGLGKNIGEFMQGLFMNWLPNSPYDLDDRPHFNVLGAAYKNNHPSSEEDIYIPIKLKA